MIHAERKKMNSPVKMIFIFLFIMNCVLFVVHKLSFPHRQHPGLIGGLTPRQWAPARPGPDHHFVQVLYPASQGSGEQTGQVTK